MSSPPLEAFLTRLYVDPEIRTRFLADPVNESSRAGLSPEECAELEQIDRIGLAFAAESFRRKLAHHRQSTVRTSFWQRLITETRARLRSMAHREPHCGGRGTESP